MSWQNFLASLILTNREIPLEYNLMTCLPNTFTFFSPFSVISRCLYSTYFLLIVLSLSLPTLSCVHLLPNKYPLLLPITFFNSVRFLCCSMPSFGVAAVSPGKSSSNISPTSVIAFINGWNHRQMKTNIRYKGNTNNTSVIISVIKIESQKLPAMLLCLGKPPRRFLLLLYLHFIFISFLCLQDIEDWIFDLYLYCLFVDVLHSHLLSCIIPHPSVDYRRIFTPILYFQPSPSQSDLWHFHSNFSGIILPRALRFWVGVFYPQAFLNLRSFTDISDSTCIYEGSP